MSKKVLFVDDEQNLLDAVSRQLRRYFDIDTALGGAEGIERLRKDSSYAVVVVDMRMPEMDGVEFFRHVERLAPNAVRMMLTGNSEQQTAIDAVNKGKVFRFLNKPCDKETMVANLMDCVRHYELVLAEEELLNETLLGVVEILTEILALTNAAAFSRIDCIRYYVGSCCRAMGINDGWKYEIAAMFSQVGYAIVPIEVLEKTLVEQQLTEEEESMLFDATHNICQMMMRIPRMEDSGEMIARMHGVTEELDECDGVSVFGARLLRVCTLFDRKLFGGASREEALLSVRLSVGDWGMDIINALESVPEPLLEETICLVGLDELELGMVLAQNIKTKNNTIVVRCGQVVSLLMIKRLQNFKRSRTLPEKIRVYRRHVLDLNTSVRKRC